jgi:hypothetical protein
MTHARPVVDLLAATPGRVVKAARADDRPRDDGEWSAQQVVLHLVAVEEQVWHARLRQLSVEAHPTWSWVEPGLWDGAEGRTLEGALAAFADRRATTIALLDGTTEAGWARRGTHERYGELDVEGLMRIAVDHDQEHLASLGGSIAGGRSA